MKIVIAPNAFKGSLDVLEAARAMARGARKAYPRAQTPLLPISDGGDGLIEALTADLGGQRLHVRVRGPLGEPRRASYGWLPGRIAVVEMARASGLALVPPGRRDPLRATSFGTGQLIDAALRRGARQVLVGLGGSASSDGGAGMAQALGCRLLDESGRELAAGAAALRGLARIDAGALRRRLRGVKIVGLTDVENPLLGPQGSARVYGPQKGATPRMIPVIEAGLSRLAGALKRDLGADVAAIPGAGAAGGLGAGLMGFLKARLAAGAAYVLGRIEAERVLAGASAVVTGEGCMDQTSFYGKAPLALAALARENGVPVVCVCGDWDSGIAGRLKAAGVSAVATFKEAGAEPRSSFSKASRWAERAAELGLRKLALPAAAAVALLLPRPALAQPGMLDLRRADALYLHRDQDDNLAKSQRLLDAALAAHPRQPGLLWRKGRGLIRQGEAFKDKKDRLKYFGRAQGVLDRAIAVEPNSADAHFWLGVAMGRIGQDRGIFKSMRLVGPIRDQMKETIRLDPAYGGAHRVLGEILWQLPGFMGGDKKKAVSEFEQAVELSPDYTDNYVPLAKAYLHNQEKDKAVAVLQKGLAVKHPADPADQAGNVRDMRQLLAKIQK